jgi:hypothetical protein
MVVRRALRAVAVGLLVLPFLGVFAQAALAHHEDISTAVDCIQPDGTWNFTYTVTAATSIGSPPVNMQNPSVEVWFIFDGAPPSSNTPPDFGSVGGVLDQTGAFVWNGDEGVYPSFSGSGTAPAGTSSVVIWAVPTENWSDGTPPGGSARWTVAYSTEPCPVPSTTTTLPPMQGSITIVKITEGGAGTFPFTSESFGAFDLTTTEAGAPVSTVFAGLAPGTYNVWEGALPDGWSLTSASCSDGSSPTLIELGAGENVTCTFTNTMSGTTTTVLGTTVTRDTTPSTLPFTGSSAGGVGGAGVALVLLGGVLLLVSRREEECRVGDRPGR